MIFTHGSWKRQRQQRVCVRGQVRAQQFAAKARAGGYKWRRGIIARSEGKGKGVAQLQYAALCCLQVSQWQMPGEGARRASQRGIRRRRWQAALRELQPGAIRRASAYRISCCSVLQWQQIHGMVAFLPVACSGA